MIDFRKAIASVACAAALVGTLLALGGCSGTDAGDIAAQVGDAHVYEEQVTNYTEQFRTEQGLSDAAKWSGYLQEQGLSAEAWRDQVARSLAKRMLVESRATDLDITVDDEAVDEKLAALKKDEGKEGANSEEWDKHLAETGRSAAQVLDECRYEVLEQQVIKKELGYTDDYMDELADEYVKDTLAGKTVRKYEAATFALDKKDKAQEYLDEMKRLELDGEDFDARLAEIVVELTGDKKAEDSMKSIGWDFDYDEQTIDPKQKLRKAELAEDDVYKKVLAGTDACRIVRCKEKVVLDEKAKYATIGSASLAKLIKKRAGATLWQDKCAQYLKGLEEGADVQVTLMPSGLSYAVQG